jgi:PKD repeat protein
VFRPTQPTPGTKLTFSASSSDPQSDSLTYTWDFGDGTTGTSASTTHTYTSEGSYTAKVVVTDQHNLASTGKSSSIFVAQTFQGQPTILEANCHHFLGQPFTTTVIAPDDAKVVWDFGDGSTGSGLFASHVYSKPGIYTVTLTVAYSQFYSVGVHMTTEVATPVPLPPQRDNEFFALLQWSLLRGSRRYDVLRRRCRDLALPQHN